MSAVSKWFVPGGPVIAARERGSTSTGGVVPLADADSRWSAGRDGMESAHRGGDLGDLAPSGGEAEPQVASAADESPGDSGQTQPDPVGFSAARGTVKGSIATDSGETGNTTSYLAVRRTRP